MLGVDAFSEGNNEKSLKDLDGDLTKELGFTRSIPLAKWTGQVTVVAQPVSRTMKLLRPTSVAVVTPVDTGKGPTFGYQSN